MSCCLPIHWAETIEHKVCIVYGMAVVMGNMFAEGAWWAKVNLFVLQVFVEQGTNSACRIKHDLFSLFPLIWSLPCEQYYFTSLPHWGLMGRGVAEHCALRIWLNFVIWHTLWKGKDTENCVAFISSAPSHVVWSVFLQHLEDIEEPGELLYFILARGGEREPGAHKFVLTFVSTFIKLKVIKWKKTWNQDWTDI